MIRVSHHVGPSRFGVGLIIDQDVRKGNLILDANSQFTYTYRVADFPLDIQAMFQRYGYTGKPPYQLTEGWVYYNADDSRFMNHSDDPSCLYSPLQQIYIASKDLIVGDELTCDYNDFCIRGMYGFDF